jgi:hypothetical protein
VNEIPDALILPNRFIRIDRDTQQAYATIERAAGALKKSQFNWDCAMKLRVR